MTLIGDLVRSVRTGPHLRAHRIRLDYPDGSAMYVEAKLPWSRRGFTLLSAILTTIEQAVIDKAVRRGWSRWSIEPPPVETLSQPTPTFDGVDRDAYPVPLRKEP